jgi:hypothetical protein
VPRVANKDQQAWRNTIFGEFGLCTIFGSFLVSFPSDTGHAPSLRNTFFGGEEMSTPLIFTEIEKRIQKMPIFYPKTIDINRKISLTLQV